MSKPKKTSVASINKAVASVKANLTKPSKGTVFLMGESVEFLKRRLAEEINSDGNSESIASLALLIVAKGTTVKVPPKVATKFKVLDKPPAMTKIAVNGRVFRFQKPELTFDDICGCAGFASSEGCTITYKLRNLGSELPFGALLRIENGMVINVARTDNA